MPQVLSGEYFSDTGILSRKPAISQFNQRKKSIYFSRIFHGKGGWIVLDDLEGTFQLPACVTRDLTREQRCSNGLGVN